MKKSQTINTTDAETLMVYTEGNASGMPLVLVHGYPDEHTVWDNIVDELKAKYFIIRYDVRGAGASSRPKKVSAYKLEQLSKDLDSVVKAVIGDKPFHLIAHDWGSLQSWESATNNVFTGRILSYTSISGVCIDQVGYQMRHQLKTDQKSALNQLLHSWYIMFFQVPVIAPAIWRHFGTSIFPWYMEKVEDKADMHMASTFALDAEYGVNLYRANFAPRLLFPRKRFAICPVHQIVLTQDNYVTQAVLDSAKPWVEELTRSVVEGKHWAVVSQAQKIARLIDDYLSK